jgi:hypothetical protein
MSSRVRGEPVGVVLTNDQMMEAIINDEAFNVSAESIARYMRERK